MGACRGFLDLSKMLILLSILSWGLPSCTGGETCSISQGSTTITAFCETSCCSTQCCTVSETEGVSTVAIVLSVLIVVIAILLVIVILVVLYRKKKPACCFKAKEEEEDKEKVLEDEENSPKNLMDKDSKKKEGPLDECSSGYSSSQSVKSISNPPKKAPAVRAASPFGGHHESSTLSGPVAPSMSLPRSTAPPPTVTRFANGAFDKSGDRTDVLNMKKPKTVTFKHNKIDSPRGSISLNANEPQRIPYPPVLPPLYKDENTSSDLFSTTSRSNDSPSNGHGHNKRHRKSYPTDNKIGFMWDDNDAKPKSTIFKTSSSSPPPSKWGANPLKDSPTNPQSISDMFDIAQIPQKPATSSRRGEYNYNARDSSYVPTIVKVADSKDSVDSIEADDVHDSKNVQRTSSFSSPYLATPYTVKKNKRALGTANGFSQSATNSPMVIRPGDLFKRSSVDPPNASGIYVSSLMQQRTAASSWDSPV